jgi:hypothetical protein
VTIIRHLFRQTKSTISAPERPLFVSYDRNRPKPESPEPPGRPISGRGWLQHQANPVTPARRQVPPELQKLLPSEGVLRAHVECPRGTQIMPSWDMNTRPPYNGLPLLRGDTPTPPASHAQSLTGFTAKSRSVLARQGYASDPAANAQAARPPRPTLAQGCWGEAPLAPPGKRPPWPARVEGAVQGAREARGAGGGGRGGRPAGKVPAKSVCPGPCLLGAAKLRAPLSRAPDFYLAPRQPVDARTAPPPALPSPVPPSLPRPPKRIGSSSGEGRASTPLREALRSVQGELNRRFTPSPLAGFARKEAGGPGPVPGRTGEKGLVELAALRLRATKPFYAAYGRHGARFRHRPGSGDPPSAPRACPRTHANGAPGSKMPGTIGGATLRGEGGLDKDEVSAWPARDFALCLFCELSPPTRVRGTRKDSLNILRDFA